jgi:monoamine oxidase
MDADVLVLGAGIAGLVAADALRDRGIRPLVLEARDRVGGRIWTDRTFSNAPVELGAEFIHGSEAATWPLVQALGLDTRPWPKGDESLVHLGRGRWSGMATLRGSDPAVERARSWQDLPLTPPRPGESLTAYTRRLGFTPAQRRMVARTLANACGDAPGRLAADAALASFACGPRGGPGDGAAADARAAPAAEARAAPGASDAWIVDGYDRLVEHLARGLEIRFRAAVVTLSHGPRGVRARLASGETVAAAAAVLALPLALLRSGALSLDPPLPRPQREAIRRLRTGVTIKLLYRLEAPLVDDPATLALYARGPVPMWWTPTPGANEPVWTGLVSGAAAAALLALPPRDALDLALAALAGELQRDAPRALDARLVAWPSDPDALGGYSYVPPRRRPPPAAPSPRSLLARPAPPLAIAGEATAADAHGGTVHGAFESGRRAAEEVLAVLGWRGQRPAERAREGACP